MAGVGFRFRPTEEFLLGVLERKRRDPLYDVRQSVRFPEDLPEMYMYGPGKEPWKLFSGAHEITELSETHDPKRKIRQKYVVTELNRIGKKNCSRFAGDGCWMDKSTKKPVYYRGQKVGHWSTLTYEYSGDDGAADGKRYYYMNELRLSKPCNYAICRVMKNMDKDCQIKFGTKRSRQNDDDQDLQPATKRSRCEEESQAFGSCSKIVQEEVDDPQESYTEAIDFSGPIEDIPDSDPDFFGWVSDMLGQNQEHQVVDNPEMQASCSSAMADPELFGFDPQLPMSMNDEYSGPVYVPDMSGVGQDQEQQVGDFWDFAEMQANWAPGCSSTMPDQGSFADQWSMEELMRIIA